MHKPDVLDFPAEHVVDPIARRPLAARAGGAAIYVAVSLALNLALVAWLARIGWPLRSAEATAPISVELVDRMPGEGHGSTKGKAGPRPGADTPVAGDKEAKADVGEPAGTPTPPKSAEPAKTAEPLKPPAPPAEPVKPVVPSPEPLKPGQPEGPELEATSQPAPKPAAPTAPTPSAAPPSPPAAAVPPPPEHPDADTRPQLVEAPKLPARPANPQATVASSEPPPSPPDQVSAEPSKPPAGSPPSTPAILTAPGGAEAVAPPAPPVEKPHVPTAEEKRQAEATAKLAAALPYGSPMGFDPFGGGGSDQSAAQSYRAAVYANFSKANDLVAEAGQKHIKGQAVVAFSVDDQGNLASLGVAVSSGNAEVDATALELIRRAAPFPPPPAGAQRSFSPAIGFGMDE